MAAKLDQIELYFRLIGIAYQHQHLFNKIW